MTGSQAQRQDGRMPIRGIDGLLPDWDFEPSFSVWLRVQRAVRRFWRTGPPPASAAIKAPQPREEWIVYFVYAPDGRLHANHRFTLERLRDTGCGLLIVCATESPQNMPAELLRYADALYWKGLSGYDFSAYAVALQAIGQASPGARVLVLNDSVFGPFVDLRPFLRQTRWDLAGFTASSLLENHIQSYAFVLAAVEPVRLRQLEPVFTTRQAFNLGLDTVLCHEVYLARLASRHMKVGAYWYSTHAKRVPDPTLVRPFELLDAGFPFLKKSLLGKFSKLQDIDAVRQRLLGLGHPLDGLHIKPGF